MHNEPRALDVSEASVWAITLNGLPPTHDAHAQWFSEESAALQALETAADRNARLWSSTILSTTSVSNWTIVRP